MGSNRSKLWRPPVVTWELEVMMPWVDNLNRVWEDFWASPTLRAQHNCITMQIRIILILRQFFIQRRSPSLITLRYQTSTRCSRIIRPWRIISWGQSNSKALTCTRHSLKCSSNRYLPPGVLSSINHSTISNRCSWQLKGTIINPHLRSRQFNSYNMCSSLRTNGYLNRCSLSLKVGLALDLVQFWRLSGLNDNLNNISLHSWLEPQLSNHHQRAHNIYFQ